MKMFSRTSLLLVLALVCVQSVAEAQTASKPRRDRNVLTAEEIDEASASTVYELVRSKRPRWLSVRGSSTLRTSAGTDMLGKPMTYPAEAEIAVYIDDVKHGSQETLRSMSTNTIETIQYLDAGSATQRFGTNHEYGAILIRLRGRQPSDRQPSGRPPGGR
ncbi:MAG: hypothetical protein M3403_02735 [Gemmatimonadota bacterium]|nr:hypothetical protein [Gemmatimonadota bacterium]